MHALRQSHERVRAFLSSKHSGTNEEHAASSAADLRSWSAAQLTGIEQKDPSKAWNFRDFERSFKMEPARATFPQPTSLPPIPKKIDAGPFPSLEAVLSRVGRWETVGGSGGSVCSKRARLLVVKLKLAGWSAWACMGGMFLCIFSCYSIRLVPSFSDGLSDMLRR